MRVAERRDRVDGTAIRQGEVEEEDVGEVLGRECVRLTKRRRFSHPFDLLGRVEHHTQAEAHHRMIVDDTDTNHSAPSVARAAPSVT